MIRAHEGCHKYPHNHGHTPVLEKVVLAAPAEGDSVQSGSPRMYGTRPVTQARCLLDTGSTFSRFPQEALDRIEAPSRTEHVLGQKMETTIANGTVNTRPAEPEPLRSVRVMVPGAPIVSLEVRHLDRSPDAHFEYDGIIGRDVLQHFAVMLDPFGNPPCTCTSCRSDSTLQPDVEPESQPKGFIKKLLGLFGKKGG